MSKEQFREIAFACNESRPKASGTAKGNGRTISGYAIVFGKDSVVLSNGRTMFRERIEPGAITMSALLKYDITMTAWHNREILLARWRQGEGTLKLSVDKVGVFYSFDAPESPKGEDVLVSVKRGDMTGASFTFSSLDTVQQISIDDDGVERHSITKLGTVIEMTIAANPAYPDTTAGAREKKIAEDKKRQERESFLKQERQKIDPCREMEQEIEARQIELKNRQ